MHTIPWFIYQILWTCRLFPVLGYYSQCSNNIFIAQTSLHLSVSLGQTVELKHAHFMKASIRLTEMAEPAGMSTSSTTAILPSIGTAADGSRLSRPQGAQGTFCPGVSLNYNPSLTAPGFFITDAGCCRLGPGVGIFESGLLGIQPLLSWWRPRLPFGKLPSSSFKQDSRKCQSSCVVFSLGGPKLDQFDGI